jgi:hypothetical protein
MVSNDAALQLTTVLARARPKKIRHNPAINLGMSPRSARGWKLNIGVGIWLVIAPLILGHGSMVPVINSFIVGIMMIGLAMTSGRTSGKFPGGWHSVLDSAKNESGAT